MKKAFLIATAITLFAIGFLGYRHFSVPEKHVNPSVKETEVKTYWTCPMHHEIHLDKPGECPICHMKLVKVRTESDQAAQMEKMDARAPVSVSPYQLKLLGVQKVAVEKMDLLAHIPISGRVISPARVAFQVYESDFRYIRSSLKFVATSSLFPDENIRGSIASVDSIADPTSRTVRVIGLINKGPHGLISETTFSGEVEIPLKGVIAIPESAVLHAGNSDLVYLVQNDGSLKPQRVVLGQKTESYYEVLKGLTLGQFVSSGPNFLIDSEARIRAVSMPNRNGESKPPSCPLGQHWDISMAMCMPGEK